MSSSGEFTILYRLKSNQRNPVKIRVDTTLVKDDYLSLDNLYTILNKEFQDLEVSTAKIRYLQNMKYYVDLPREGVPFDANRTAELYICLPPNKVYHTNTDGSLKKNPTGVQFEAAFSQKLDVMERTIQSMESKLIKIAEKIGFRTHLRDSSQGVPASSNNSQNLHMGVFRSQNGEEESQTGEMIEEDKDKLATPTPASTGDISSFRLNLTKAVSSQPFMPELSFSLRHNMSVNVGSSSSTSRARSEFFSPHQRLQTNLFNPRDTFVLHLAILYSNPMVEIVEKKNRVQCAMLTGDPVDFNGECASILHCLESHKKKLSVHIECANCDQFIQIVKEKPLIIHIMCHGDFDPDKGEYFLEFENHKAELLRLYPSKLKELLIGTNLSDIRLVFINACHSEAIGRAFLELGVRSVIVASSEHKLNDEFAKVFSKLFYDELLEGKTIGEAFDNARVQLKAVNLDASDSCCCGHEHEPNCQWYAEYKQQGRYLAHAAHECLCSCPARMYHIHDPECYWAEDFMMKYDVMPPEEDGREIYLCCCRPHLTHDETMKLQLLYKEDKKVEIEVFSNLDSGKVNQVRKVFFGENKFQDCVTVGKNRTIYQIFNSFTYENVRLIYLVGESGSGKSMLSKHIANYMTERRKVDNTYYLNMDKVSNVAVVLARIPDYRQITSFDYKTNSAGQELLVILDNMDTILTNHYKAFRTALQELLEQTKLKFLIVATNSNWAANSGSQWQEKIVQVPPLNTQAAAKLLKMMANDYLPSSLRNVVNLQSHPIFKASEGFTLKATPKVISDIAFLLKKGNKTLDKIYEDYCLREGEKGKAVKIEDQSLKERKEFIESLKTDKVFLYQVLLFIAHFSNGILSRDLSDANTMVPLPENWMVSVIYISLVNEVELISSPTSLIDLKRNLDDKLHSGQTPYAILSEFKKSDKVANNDVLMINDIKLGSTVNEICFCLDPTIRTIVAESDELGHQIFEQKCNVLRYYIHLFGSIMNKNTTSHTYLESIVENTLLNSSKWVWTIDYVHSDQSSYINDDAITTTELQEIIKNHDANIRVLLNDTSEMSMTEGLKYALRTPDRESVFLNLLEQFLMTLWSISKIHEYYEVAEEYVELFRRLNSTESSQSKLKVLEIKTELFACDIIYRKLKKSRTFYSDKDIYTVESQLNLVERLVQKFDREQWLPFYTEFLIVKCYTLKLDKIKRNKKEEEIQILVKKMKDQLLMLSETKDDRYAFLIAKLSFVIVEHSYNVSKKGSDGIKYIEEEIKKLQEAAQVFDRYGSPKLYCRALILLAHIYVNKQVESLSYAKKALKTANKYSIKELDKEIKTLIECANTHIRCQLQNKLYFLDSYPLRDMPSNMQKCGGVNFYRSLREDIKSRLKDLQKNILVHFDTLKKNILDELFTESIGCKLLAIDFMYLMEDAIVLEGEDFSAERLTLEGLRQTFCSGDRKINIDILLVISDHPYKIIRQFADLIDVPVTIYFEFHKKPTGDFDIHTMFLMREFMYSFLKSFVKEICAGRRVNNAVENAKNESLETILHNLKMSYETYNIYSKEDKLYTKKGNFSGQIIENFYKDVIQVYTRGQDSSVVCELTKGIVSDTSAYNSKDIYQPLGWFLRRDDMVVELYDMLNRHTWINLYGSKGTGKTTFLHRFANEVRRRRFFPDGVFIIKFRDLELKGYDDVRALFNTQFGEKFDHNINDYFKGTKRLVIIDDFNKIIDNVKYKYPFFFLRALKLNNVKTIFVSRSRLNKIEEVENCVPWELKSLSPTESLAYMLIYHKNWIFGTDTDITSLLKSKFIIAANGDPKRLAEIAPTFIANHFNFLDRRKKKKVHNPTEIPEEDDDEEDSVDLFEKPPQIDEEEEEYINKIENQMSPGIDSSEEENQGASPSTTNNNSTTNRRRDHRPATLHVPHPSHPYTKRSPGKHKKHSVPKGSVHLSHTPTSTHHGRKGQSVQSKGSDDKHFVFYEDDGDEN